MSKIREHIEKHPGESTRLVGLSYEQLMQLIERAENLYEQQLERQKEQNPRLIKSGGGRPPKLATSDQILLTLVYLHHLPTFQMLGVQFEVSESTANLIFHHWLEILRELLPASLLEQVKKNESEFEWIQEILTDFKLIVDSYEQPMERPTDLERQKKCYSGKKKNHTLKNQLIVVPSGKEIVDVVVGETGATADINIWRSRKSQLSPQQEFSGDLAYVGETKIETPHKKTRTTNITPEQKKENQERAKKRIVVEHLIRLLKIFRIASERFRLRVRKYESAIMVVCGLVRYRIGAYIMCC